MHALVTPPVWWAEVTLALNGLSTTTIVRLILGVKPPGAADPLNIGALVVVRHAARAVVILDFRVVRVTPDAMEERGRFDRREEGRDGGEGVPGALRDLRERVCVQRFGGDGREERVERLGRRWDSEAAVERHFGGGGRAELLSGSLLVNDHRVRLGVLYFRSWLLLAREDAEHRKEREIRERADGESSPFMAPFKPRGLTC